MSQEFVTGVTAGLIWTGAILGSGIFRNLALALAAGAIVFVFIRGDGVSGLMAASELVVRQFHLHPQFGRGAICGAVAAVFVGCVLWSRRSSR